MATTVQKAQRSIANFNSTSTMFSNTLGGCLNLPIYDVHWAPPGNVYYKLNIDATDPIEGGKWGIVLL